MRVIVPIPFEVPDSVAARLRKPRLPTLEESLVLLGLLDSLPVEGVLEPAVGDLPR